MNGIHDMGGMHGMGPIDHEQDEPVFHARWEARMLGMRRSATLPPELNIDRWRHLRELIPPYLYLSRSYYDHWYMTVVAALLQAGWVTEDEVKSGHATAG